MVAKAELSSLARRRGSLFVAGDPRIPVWAKIANDKKWSDPNHHDHMSNKIRLVWSNPAHRARVSEKLRGHATSAETRKKIAEKKKARFASLDARFQRSKEQGGIMQVALPLFLRGARVEDVMNLCDAPREQVENCLRKLRKSGLIKRPTAEETKLLMRKSMLGVRKKVSERSRNPEQALSIGFAKKLIQNGFISNNILYWNRLNDLFSKGKKALPDEFSDRLRLEVAYFAAVRAKKGDMRAFSNYRRIGKQIYDNWFEHSLTEEEKFIINSIVKGPRITEIDAQYRTLCTQFPIGVRIEIIKPQKT